MIDLFINALNILNGLNDTANKSVSEINHIMVPSKIPNCSYTRHLRCCSSGKH